MEEVQTRVTSGRPTPEGRVKRGRIVNLTAEEVKTRGMGRGKKRSVTKKECVTY